MQLDQTEKYNVESEIDLKIFFGNIWSYRNLLLKTVFGFIVVGVFFSLTLRDEYRVESKLLVESVDDLQSNFGSLGSLAGLAGISFLDQQQGSMSPEVYPEILNSTPFISELINAELTFEDLDSKMSSFNYFKGHLKMTIWNYLFEYLVQKPLEFIKPISIDRVSKSRYVYFNKEDWIIYDDFRSRISVNFDPSTSVLIVSVLMPDDLAATELCDLVITNLTNAATDYKIEKAKYNLKFIQERYNEAKTEYSLKQDQLGVEIDHNLNIQSAQATFRIRKMEQEVEVLFSVYKGLAQQLEQAKINIEERTPIFTIIEYPRIPEDEHSPKKALIVLFFAVIGLSFGIVITQFKQR